MGLALVYITAPNREEAERLGAMLVERRLAACINVLSGVKSVFWWGGKMERSGEVALLAKTREDLVEDLTREVVSAHSGEVPCVVALPIIGGNPEFLKFMEDETR